MGKLEKDVKRAVAATPEDLVLPSAKTQPRRKRLLAVLLGVLIIALVAIAGYYYWQYRNAKENASAVTQQEVRDLVAEVSNIIELPQGVDPTVATVSDKGKLEDQDFFKSAENGDKILIYASAKMAILYRPSAKKIIKVAPLVLDSNATNSSTLTNTSNSNSATNAN